MLVSFEAANPLSLAFWPLPLSLVWQVLRDDGSPYLHLRYPWAALLDGILGEAPSSRLLFPLQALMISRKPGEHAVTLSPKGAGIAPARRSSCQGFYLAVNPLKLQPRRTLIQFLTNESHAKSVADPFKPCFPERFEGVFHHGLHTSINDGGNAERPSAFALRDIHPAHGVDLVKSQLAELVAEPSSFFGGRHHHAIDTGGVFALIHLGDATHAFQHVRLTPQHQSLQRPDPSQVVGS